MGAEEVFASRRESAWSTLPVEPALRSAGGQNVTSGRQAFVARVPATHLRERDHLALVRTLHASWFRGIFAQAQGSDAGGSTRNRL